MNGISLLVSKCLCPMYNLGTSNKINLIPHGRSNLHLRRSSPSLATTRVLKHRVCSSFKSNSKDETGVKLNASGAFLQESGKEDLVIFSVGDIIQAGSVEGRVVEMRPTSTVLFCGENGRLIMPYDALFSQYITNKTSGKPYDNMGCEVGFDIGDLDKLDDISEEIRKVMDSNPYVLHEIEKPTCFRHEAKNLVFRCHLKHMEPDIYFTAKEEILQQAGEIIEKHGGTSLKCFYWTYY